MFKRKRFCCQENQKQTSNTQKDSTSQPVGISGDKPFPITSAKEGTTVRLYKIEGGHQVKRRLTVIGFLENEPVRVIKKSYFGPLVLEVKGSRFAVGRGEAEKILVRNA